MPSPEAIAQNLHRVKTEIARSCEGAGRNPEEVTLVAVTKTHSAQEIQTLYDLGLRDFGESRWQEAKPKIDVLPKDMVWHFIGALQSNKARAVAESFAVIHSITSVRQIEQIAKGDRTIDVFVEVNLANEPQKQGIPVNLLDETIESVVKCKLTRFRGLMTIGSRFGGLEDSRKIFRNLAVLNHRFGGSWLSMGMSDDFDVAIREGSTHVRIGSALFREV